MKQHSGEQARRVQGAGIVLQGSVPSGCGRSWKGSYLHCRSPIELNQSLTASEFFILFVCYSKVKSCSSALGYVAISKPEKCARLS